LIIVLGVEGLIIGVINLIQAFRGGGWGIGVLGALSILFGLILLGNPFLAALGLPIILGIMGIVFGVIAIFGAFRFRNAEKEAAQAASTATRAATIPAVETMVAKTEATGAGVVSAAGAGVAQAGAGIAAAGATAFTAVESTVEETKEEVGEVAEEMVEKVETVPETAAEFAEDVGEKVGGVAESVGETVSAGVVAVSGMVEEVGSAVKTGDIDFSELDENAKFGYELEYIEGIGPAIAQKLHELGVTTIRTFFERGVTPKGRDELAELSGISRKLILEWINHVDLYRIKGVGSEYADLLEAAGVDTVVELANRNATNLFNKMVAVNEEKKLVRKIPVESQVQDWVDQAKTLPRKVMY
jgi:predicted flap endonuclease-1-like 5' DNA nuclease